LTRKGTRSLSREQKKKKKKKIIRGSTIAGRGLGEVDVIALKSARNGRLVQGNVTHATKDKKRTEPA